MPPTTARSKTYKVTNNGYNDTVVHLVYRVLNKRRYTLCCIHFTWWWRAIWFILEAVFIHVGCWTMTSKDYTHCHRDVTNGGCVTCTQHKFWLVNDLKHLSLTAMMLTCKQTKLGNFLCLNALYCLKSFTEFKHLNFYKYITFLQTDQNNVANLKLHMRWKYGRFFHDRVLTL